VAIAIQRHDMRNTSIPAACFEIVDSQHIDPLIPFWTDLCNRSADENVYYSPNYTIALLKSICADLKIDVIAAWEAGKLIAFLPVTRRHFPFTLLGPSASAWRTKYTFGCTPLIDKDRTEIATRLLVDGMSSLDRGEWLLPAVNTNGPTCTALKRELDRRGAPWVFTNAFDRASLEPSCTYEQYIRNHVSASRRKSIERKRRRLQDLGKLEFQSHTCGEELDRAVSSFLGLEAAGWKGRAGTALACDPADLAFAHAAFRSRSRRSPCRVDMLLLDGRMVAAVLTVFAGGTGFTIKTCYDETFRHFAPGLVLELELIRSLLTDKWAERLDAATTGSHVVDVLWSGRIEVADLLFSIAPRQASIRLSAIEKMLAARRRLKAAAKSLVARLPVVPVLSRRLRLRKSGATFAARARGAGP